MPSMEKKYNAFALVTYAEPAQVTEILEEKYNEGTLTAYAHILHDKDWVDNENGERVRKIPHTHIVLTSSSYRTKTSVENWFKATKDFKGELANTMVQSTRMCIHKDGTMTNNPIDVQGATFYLVHEDKNVKPLPDKHQYSWEEVISRNLEMLKNPPEVHTGRPKKEDKTFEILEDMLAGANLREMGKKYGRDFILHFRQFKDFARAVRLQEEDFDEITNDAYTEAWLDTRGDAVRDSFKASIENVKLTKENETMKAKLRALGEEI